MNTPREPIDLLQSLADLLGADDKRSLTYLFGEWGVSIISGTGTYSQPDDGLFEIALFRGDEIVQPQTTPYATPSNVSYDTVFVAPVAEICELCGLLAADFGLPARAVRINGELVDSGDRAPIFDLLIPAIACKEVVR